MYQSQSNVKKIVDCDWSISYSYSHIHTATTHCRPCIKLSITNFRLKTHCRISLRKIKLNKKLFIDTIGMHLDTTDTGKIKISKKTENSKKKTVIIDFSYISTDINEIMLIRVFVQNERIWQKSVALLRQARY